MVAGHDFQNYPVFAMTPGTDCNRVLSPFHEAVLEPFSQAGKSSPISR